MPPEYYTRRDVLRSGNCEWVTAIECTNALGRTLSPCIVFKGKVFIVSCFDNLPGIGASKLARTDGRPMK